MSAFASALESACRPFVSLTAAQLSLLEAHYSLLETWNRRMNLTAVRSIEDAVRDHYAESIFLATCLEQFADWPVVQSLVDVGSGAGFPGVPIGVLHLGVTVELFESHQRKSVFLREATRGMRNISVNAARFESRPGPWDVLVSRAVAWNDFSAHALRVSKRFGLLVGPSDLLAVRSTSGISWMEPIPLPTANRGYVLLGRW